MGARRIFQSALLVAGLPVAGLLFATPPAWAAPALAPRQVQRQQPYVAGELLVKFRNEYPTQSWADAVKRLGAKTLHVLNVGNQTFHHVQLRSGVSVQQAIDEFALQEPVEYAQPNYIYHATSVTPVVPSDPMFAQQWGFNNTGQTISTGDYSTNNPGTAGKDMSLESAWAVTTDCSSVTVAVVDTGVNYNNTDLAPNMWVSSAYPNHGYDFVAATNTPMDLNGHGTHVAGIIGAAGNNGIGTTGVCWKASIMAVRVLDSMGDGTTTTITQGVTFAVQNGARVINMSLGGSAADPAFEAAIQNAGENGVVTVVAAGNDGTDNDSGTTPTYPCNYTESNILCVAALDQSFGLASFSNYGSTSVDIGAPGTNVLSSWAGTTTTIDESFNTLGTLDWTLTGTGWGYQLFTLDSGSPPTPTLFDMISVPSDWDSANVYASDLSTEVYKGYDLSTAASATLSFQAFVATAPGDSLAVSYDAAGEDPAMSGTQLATFSGEPTSPGTAGYYLYDLSPCDGSANCTIGFQFTSGASQTASDTGVAIVDFVLSQLTLGATGTNTLDGTSMATPHVAGLVAMLLAFNPSYGASDAIQAVLNGGVAAAALAGKSTSGNAANALGALSYIETPTNVKVQVPVP